MEDKNPTNEVETTENDSNLSNDLALEEVENFEQMYEESMRHIQEGEIVRGIVVRIDRDAVLVDIGYKSEGAIPIQEFQEDTEKINIGDEIDVYLEATEDNDGLIVLSKEKAYRIKIWEDLEKAYDNNEIIEGIILSRIKGGLTVDVGLKGFLPGSQVDLRPVRNLDKLINQKLKMKIIKLNRRRGNIVLSRRVLLEEERKEAKKETLAHLEVNQIVDGVVKNITEYGAFIDLGGIDGLLHITDMTWGRISHPSELFAIGDKIKVMVLKYDSETERVSLGHKQITPDPWDAVEEKYPVSARVRGKVVSLTDYGAFVELEEGVEGLVHVSEMSWTKRIRHPSKVVDIGDIIEAVVLSLDKANKRISLGMKQVEPNPWSIVDVKYPVGSEVEGKVRNLTDFGAFLALEEGIDGLIHISDMSWSQKIKHPSEILKKGQKVKAKVLKVDKENERLSLGLKQLLPDPWDEVPVKYPIGTTVKAKVVKITNFGAFAEIEEGVEGLIHISELSKEKVSKPEKVVSVDNIIEAKIIKLDMEERKIGLSIKAFLEEEEKNNIESFNTDDTSEGLSVAQRLHQNELVKFKALSTQETHDMDTDEPPDESSEDSPQDKED